MCPHHGAQGEAGELGAGLSWVISVPIQNLFCFSQAKLLPQTIGVLWQQGMLNRALSSKLQLAFYSSAELDAADVSRGRKGLLCQ